MVKFLSINSYCPLAVAASDVINGIYSVRFDNVAVSETIVSMITSEIDVTKDFEESPYELDAPYGRNIVLASTSANTSPVYVYGYDYLGQPMVEKFTLNGTTAVSGKKAFKYIQKIHITNSPATAGIKLNVTAGLIMGLPYRTSAILAQTKNGVAGSTVTLTAPINITQTNITGDPRGTVTLGSYTATANIVLVCMASPEVFTIDDEKVGGLFGLPHYHE